MVRTAKHFYEFGPFRVDTLKRRLLRGGEIVPLTPKAFDTLLVLVENGGRLVEKDDLMERVWPGVAVEENNLTQNISALRKALGERRGEPQYIATVPGLGYRFIASVEETWPADEESKPVAQAENISTAENGAAQQNGFAHAAKRSTPVIESEIQQAVAENAQPVNSQAANSQTIVETRADDAKVARASETSESGEGRGQKFFVRSRKSLAVAALAVVVAVAVGYYFFAARAKRAEVAGGTNTQIKSIAILPFKQLGAEGDDQFMGLGMADALITKLSGIREINVRPTSSIIKFANAQDPGAAGRELGVDSVLDGRVQKSGDRIRVTVQLVRAGDGAPLWGDTFDEKYTDIFAVEDRISEQVVRALLPTLNVEQKQKLSKHYTEDTDAYQSYTKGRYFWNKRTSEDIRKAVGYFEDAIIEDPNYALAYSALADSYATLGVLDDLPPGETMPKARSAAMRALELDDTLAEAHTSLAYVKHRYEWDWPGAEREFRRALELDPDYARAHQWYGWYLVSVGSFDDAEAEFRRAQQLDPLSLYTNMTVGAPYFYSGQYDRAAEQYRKVAEMDSNFWLAHRWLAEVYERQGRYDDATAELKTILKSRPEDATQLFMLGYVYAASGRQAEARQVLAEMERASKRRYVAPYYFVLIHTGLGEKDQAFAWLAEALRVRDDSLAFIKVNRRLGPLRTDPRFAEMFKDTGLPQ
jgi:DNA-binding winged helix-turn-helix (wHTH) protein/TolB-like protein/tetratricopeptide (TPR) repeat protein